MASYKVRIKASAAKEIERIEPRKVRRAVVERIRALALNPRPAGCEKLAGGRGQYRVRQGTWRIVYELRDNELVVVVVKVGHRRHQAAQRVKCSATAWHDLHRSMPHQASSPPALGALAPD